jgi:8-oxo-dGTP pyrophosphatase MutT (NUDIX family)
MLIMKRDPTSGRYQVLLHRRGRGLREEYHWGIPGGGLERYERGALGTDGDLNTAIRRRAALRETIEETGRGKLTDLIGSDVSVGAIEGTPIRAMKFKNVLVPEGMKRMVSDSSVTVAVPSQFPVFLYVLDPSLDGPFISHWCPRAMEPCRGEIDEFYDKHGVVYGYKWVDIKHLFATPDRPVHGSSMGMCDFVRKLFVEPQSVIAIRRRIAELDLETLPPSAESVLGGSKIPQGSYVRFQIDSHSKDTIARYVEYLQDSFPGFLSQLSPQAGLGCHPFHITICSSLSRSGSFVCSLLILYLTCTNKIVFTLTLILHPHPYPHTHPHPTLTLIPHSHPHIDWGGVKRHVGSRIHSKILRLHNLGLPRDKDPASRSYRYLSTSFNGNEHGKGDAHTTRSFRSLCGLWNQTFAVNPALQRLVHRERREPAHHYRNLQWRRHCLIPEYARC